MRLNGLAGPVCREEEPGFETGVRSTAIGPGALRLARRAVLPFFSCHRPPGAYLEQVFWCHRASGASGEPFRGRSPRNRSISGCPASRKIPQWHRNLHASEADEKNDALQAHGYRPDAERRC